MIYIGNTPSGQYVSHYGWKPRTSDAQGEVYLASLPYHAVRSSIQKGHCRGLGFPNINSLNWFFVHTKVNGVVINDPCLFAFRSGRRSWSLWRYWNWKLGLSYYPQFLQIYPPQFPPIYSSYFKQIYFPEFAQIYPPIVLLYSPYYNFHLLYSPSANSSPRTTWEKNDICLQMNLY